MEPTAPWISASLDQTALRDKERSFIRSAYGWMFAGLMLTAGAALWVLMSAAMQNLILRTPGVMIGLIIVELGMVFFLSFRVTRMSPAAAASVFLVYSLLNGLTLSVIAFVYTQAAIFQAFIVAAGMFGAMSVYGMVTKRDLTSWGSFFFMGLIGIILASVVNLFVGSDALGFAISLVGVFIFVGLTAYDTQKLKAYAKVSGTQTTNYAVIGALALYLDFINLFLMLLRLFGRRN
jgi:FtsH-binding integral membrane protein